MALVIGIYAHKACLFSVIFKVKLTLNDIHTDTNRRVNMITYKPTFDEEELDVMVSAMHTQPETERANKILKTLFLLLFSAASIALINIISTNILVLIYPCIGMMIFFAWYYPAQKSLSKDNLKRGLEIENSIYKTLPVEYIFDCKNVVIKSQISVCTLKWSAFRYYGEINNYIYLALYEGKCILINKSKLTQAELIEFYILLKPLKKRTEIKAAF